QAYVALARRFHPDHIDPRAVDAPEASRRMQEINEAWAVLGDAARRRRLEAERPRPFRPFTTDDADESDPRLAPDVPYRPTAPESPARRAVTMAPVLLLAGSVTVGSLGVTLGYGGLVAICVVLFPLACVGLVRVPLAAAYQAGGASCLSVLTDVEFFGGSADDLRAARRGCDIPILRKDFTVDERDVVEARTMGADAVLLIVAALDDDELRRFLARAD